MTNRAFRLALVAVPFAALLVASPRLTLEQFEAPKQLGLAALAAVLALTGAVHTLRTRPALLGWLAAVALAAACSPHPAAAWLGGEEYLDGVLTCAAYAILCLAGAAASATDRARFRAALLLAAGVAAAYALAQRAGLDPFPGERFRHVRAMAGNPDFLAQQMALALPFALGTAFTATRARTVIAALALVATLTLVTGLTASRAGAVAAVCGLLLAGTLAPRRRDASRIPAMAVGVVVAGLVAAEGLVPEDLSLISRIRTLTATDGFRIARGDIWRGTARAAIERPLTGWGPDTTGAVFLRTAPAGWADEAGLGVTARRAHNELLHWLSATGVIGLGMWLWVIISALRRRTVEDGDAMLAPAITAALIHNLFSFGTAGTLPVFWVLLGMRSEPAGAAPRRAPGFHPGWIPAAAALSGVAAIRFAAGAWGYVGQEAERADRIVTAGPAFSAAARMLPLSSSAAIRAGRSAELAGRPREALGWFERGAALAPLDGLALGHVGRVRSALARAAGDRREEEAAHAQLLEAVALAPSQPSLWGAAIMSAQALGRRDDMPGLIAGLQHAAPGWAARLLNAPPPPNH